MNPTNNYTFKQMPWSQVSIDVMTLREKVFIIEQRLDNETICDQDDHNSFHVVVLDHNNQIIGCGRLNQMGRIGRVAVSIEHRGQGVGSHLLSQLVEIGEQNKLTSLTLNTETQLSEFYDQRQFQIDGPVYMKSGVPFQRMRMSLA